MKRGIHAILYAFFDADERLHRASMRRQIELCLTSDFAGIAVLGLATEVAKLSLDERCMLIDWVAEDVGGRTPLSFTIYGQSVAEQIVMVRRAERVLADCLILQPPSVGTYGTDEYLDFFGRVMDATALPVAIQNAPQYLGRGLSDADIERLRGRHANFRMIKSESSAADLLHLGRLVGPDFHVFNGRGGLELIACLDNGCAGFLLAPDLADYSAVIMRLYDQGDRLAADALYARILPAIQFIMPSIEHLICYGKRLFAARAGLTVIDRSPALRPTTEGLDHLELLLAGLDRTFPCRVSPLSQAGAVLP